MDRVVFFSINDMSSGINLQMAGALLKSVDIEQKFDLNSLFEFYHIKLYFDNHLFLRNWDDATRSEYIDKTTKLYDRIKQYLLLSDSSALLAEINLLEFNYRKSFWQLVNNLHVYKRITNDQLHGVLTTNPYHIFYILELKSLVQHFGSTIREFLLEYDKSAELLIKHEASSNDSELVPFYFPKQLTIADKEQIIEKYLTNPKANLNYVRLIVSSRDSNDFKLSPRTRLNAKKKSEELNNAILRGGNSLEMGVQVTFHKNQKEPFITTFNDQTMEVSYSEKLLDSLSDKVLLFKCFSDLFEYTDRQGTITLVNRTSELNIIEKVSTKSKNEYPTGYGFQVKNNLSLLQLKLFDHYLRRRNMSIEDVINTFIDQRLNKELKTTNLELKFSRDTATYLERIRHLAPEIEFLLKQYQLFVVEGDIDFELLQFNSTPLNFSSIGSNAVQKKYIYVSSDAILKLKYYFFSDQSPLFYVKGVEKKYDCFYELIRGEPVKYDQFQNYQKDILSTLFSDGHLLLDDSNSVKIKNEIYIQIIGILNRAEVISYWHYPESYKKVLDEMIGSQLLRFGDTLFSEPEIDYFNFFLNKKEFTNGFDIRNKYLHGTNKNSESVHETEYFYLLRLLILILLKIEDDQIVSRQSFVS